MVMRWKQVGDDPQGAFFTDEQLVERHVGRGEFRGLEFFHVNARTIINRVPASSNMPFSHTINTYRGCSHACTYCFARPTHAYLDLGIGEDFDRRIVVKVNAVERAKAELRAPSWGRHHIALGTNTDPYQRCEGKYHLTRGLIDAFAAADTPFSILTKSTLVVRDLDRLIEAAKRVAVRINLSVPTLDAAVWKATEPGTPHPRLRLEAVARINAAGIPCGVLIAPILPGLSDSDDQLREVVTAAVDAGAVSVAASLLFLRDGTRAHYLDHLHAYDPAAAAATDELYREHAYRPRGEHVVLSERVRRFAAEARQRSGRTSVVVGPRVVDLRTDGVRADVHERVREMGLGPGRAPVREPHGDATEQLALL